MSYPWLTRTVCSWLHKWGIANDPASEAERFSEACFVERFGRRRQSRPKTSVISVAKNLCNLWLLFRAFLWLKNPRNLRNPWLINDLRACKALYICRVSSTGIESSLQIRLFMQNKANFRKSQMNVNKVLTKDYEKRTLGQRGKTKPIKANQSQFKANSKPIKANKMPKQTQNKANQTQFSNNTISEISQPVKPKTAPKGSAHAIRNTIYAIRTKTAIPVNSKNQCNQRNPWLTKDKNQRTAFFERKYRFSYMKLTLHA